MGTTEGYYGIICNTRQQDGCARTVGSSLRFYSSPQSHPLYRCHHDVQTQMDYGLCSVIFGYGKLVVLCSVRLIPTDYDSGSCEAKRRWWLVIDSGMEYGVI